ncbi:uncharacterized protein [Mytilus edulis]|uniref:uncharacterized protein n=1 Tax=Mytilus edulis TaxID=6550 RepID=UPI0039EEDB0B
MDTKDVSLSLYHYMCKTIVGTEHYVKTIRLMNSVCDHLSCDNSTVYITSGSFGEGLQIRGSDLDVMFVLKYIEVHDNITSIAFNPKTTYFSLMTEDTKPCYAMLRLKSSPCPIVRQLCGNVRGDAYLSNELFNKYFLTENSPVVHGPCISDKQGTTDIAYCLRSINWVTSASQWIIRSNNSWPNENTKQMIINHGLLFVPIGSKGSPHEKLEWRMSFSVGEKFLTYTFSHTQLLCYAMMKILLKDIINTDSRCSDLLCSYYLKTILFWISEELHPSSWTPGKLIKCFMRCFHRLIYCIEYSVCPHYFIPENNLFENKIEGLDRDNLIDTLRVLFSYGWRCILFSQQISHFVLSCNVKNDQSFFRYDDFNILLESNVLGHVMTLIGSPHNFNRAVHNILFCLSRKSKYINAYFISAMCNRLHQALYMRSKISNKHKYNEYNHCLGYLLMNINHDIVSGWLMVASFLYKAKQYKKSLTIIEYALSKCTLEKIFYGTKLSVTQLRPIECHLIQKQGFVRSLKFVMADYIVFGTCQFIPMELLMSIKLCEIPPVVYGHFLSFLCHYHLNNVRECGNSLRDLQTTIFKNYFMRNEPISQSISYYCLGTANQLIGDHVSAKQAFNVTLELLQPYPYYIKQFKRLSLVASM